MKKREYLIRYKNKNQVIDDLFTTLELIIFLIYIKFNKKIFIYKINEYSFAEDE